MGDSVQTVLNEVGYGAILEFDQGTVCKAAGTFNSAGAYDFPVKSVDPNASGINDPNHRFIVMRTKQVNASDFPPIGFRTGPQWASKLALLQSQTPNGSSYNGVQVLGTDNGPGLPHHLWMYNLALGTNGTGNWGSFIQFGFNGNAYNQTNPPEYLVLDRLYLSAPTRVGNGTTMETGIAGIPGGYTSITDLYIGVIDTSNPLPQGIYFTDCGAGPLFVDNNFISAIGQGFYVESNGLPYCGSIPTSFSTQLTNRSYDDVTFTHNTLYWPLSTLQGNAAWDGLSRGQPRNQFESKVGRRWLIRGNVCNGQWAGQTEGECFTMSTNNVASLAPAETGETDWAETFNLIMNAATIASFGGTKGLGQSGPPDNAINRRALFANNFAYNIGKNLFTVQGGGAGLGPGYFSTVTGGQDLTFWNNTLGNISGDTGNNSFNYYPTWWLVGGGGPLSAGLTWQANILHLAGGVDAAYGAYSDYETGCCSNFQPSPNLTNSPQPQSLFQTAFILIGPGSMSQNAYTWGRDIVIAGSYATNLSPWTDMTQSQITTLSANLPGGDTYITGATTTARQANAGLSNINGGDPTCTPTPQNPCAAGVNVQGLEAALGIVSNVVVRPGPSALQFSYIAPDSRMCSVDTSPDGVSWTRTSDSGGSRLRAILVSGLSASASYQYRLMCYYSQTPAWFSAAWDKTNLVTDGVSAGTTASGTRTITVQFTPATGAASTKVTMTPLVGSAVSAICNSSPCAVPGVADGWNQQALEYWSGSGATGTRLFMGSSWVQ